jgi:hypothetical protein
MTHSANTAGEDSPMPAIMQGLWIGKTLSVMEQLSLASFLRHGHPYHLYVYEEVSNVPAGTVLHDGNTIVPARMIFQYTHHQSYAGFANFFRYSLLLQKGGWWVDTDVICLKPFDFVEEYVFSTEWSRGQEMLNAGVIKAPVGSAAMAYAWHVCQTKNPTALVWGEVGSQLVTEVVQKFGLEVYRKRHTVFCPLSYTAWDAVLEPQRVWGFDETTYAIHLWNEMWRRGGRDKNVHYHPACLYEQLKGRYLE